MQNVRLFRAAEEAELRSILSTAKPPAAVAFSADTLRALLHDLDMARGESNTPPPDPSDIANLFFLNAAARRRAADLLEGRADETPGVPRSLMP